MIWIVIIITILFFFERPVIVSASRPRTAAFINVSMAGLTPVAKGDE